MPTLLTGDVWCAFAQSDLLLIPTSAEVRDGRLHLDHPSAREATRRYPGFAHALGRRIMEATPFEDVPYSLIVTSRWPDFKVGAIQVRRNRQDNAPLTIIRRSTQQLLYWCRAHPSARVDLPYPGLGIGGLTRQHLDPLLDLLPERVHLWL